MNEAITNLVNQARKAQRDIAGYKQEQLDLLTQAVAWAVMKPEHNQQLSEQACSDTGLGNVADKTTKNHRKTLGLLRDLRGKISTGVLKHDETLGITKIARPIGVIAALVPSTNPVATPVNKIINALKCGNSIIVSPSPKGAKVFNQLLVYIHQEFERINAPKNLVQAMPDPPSVAASAELMKLVDLVVVTGSQNNVRRAYSSGTPAIGVGTGNVTVIIDASARIPEVAENIMKSKIFDNSTSCSSENNIICDKSVYPKLLEALKKQGGYLLDNQEKEQLKNTFWQDGELNKNLIAKPARIIAEACQIHTEKNTVALLIEEQKIIDSPFCRERMAPILTLFQSKNFDDAISQAETLLNIQGAGHSVGIHTEKVEEQAMQLATKLPTCRVIVNQAHCFATGGGFNNGLPFSLSMGCGSWGGNSIDGNLNYRHFMNISRVIRPIKPNQPSVEALLGDYLKRYDKTT